MATSGASGERADGTGPREIAADGRAVDDGPLDELERQVFAARDLHGAQRTDAQRLLKRARKQLSELTYRRALALARDTVLLTIEECVNGALAMEWEPTPRPEFSLATIEAAVAEQERSGRPVEPPEGRTA